jgi:hypothetical protein
LSNVAAVSALTQDPDTADNSASESTQVLGGSAGADLAIEITGSADTIESGQALAYRLDLSNAGPETARRVLVTAALSEGAAIGRASGPGWKCARTSSGVSCRRAMLPAGAAPPITIPLLAPGVAGTLTGTVAVSSATPDPIDGNNTGGAATTVTPVYEFAVRSLGAPRALALAVPGESRQVRIPVEIENRSPHDETIAGLAQLERLVRLTVRSLGACPDLPAALLAGPPQPALPRTLRPLDRMKVWFEVTFAGACLNDPLKSTPRSPGHEDYAVSASVDHASFDGNADTYTPDDACPRRVAPPYVVVRYPFGRTKDRGCGRPTGDGTFGDPVLIDLIEK